MMSTFGTQVLGQTEKALNAVLRRELAGSGLTEPQWVALNIALADGSPGLVGRVAGVLKVSEAEARALTVDLASAQLLGPADADGSTVQVSDAGRRLHGQIRAAVTPITERLWGDLPAEDLATAARVLSTVLDRANAELGPAEASDDVSFRREG
jgi:DNA-binding MarR family transcriptional regulator